MFLGREEFSASRICGQIAVLQVLFWASLALNIFFWDTLFSVRLEPLSLQEQLLDPAAVAFDSTHHVIVAISLGATSLIFSFALMLVVKRAKKCLDFSSTTYGIHFVVQAAYSQSFPLDVHYWVVVLVCLIVSVVLGELLCMRGELKEIPLTSV